MSAAPLLKVLNVSIEVVKGPNAGQSHDFEKAQISLGRGPENDLIFAQDVKISRQHIELIVSMNQVIVRNLSQKNPISVDGEVVNEKSIRPGGTIRFGETELKVNFERPAEAKANLSVVPQATVGALKPMGSLQNAPVATAPAQASFPPVPGVNAQAPASFTSNAMTQPQSQAVGMPQQGGGVGAWNQQAPAGARSVGAGGSTYRPPSAGGGRFKLYAIVGVIVLGGAYLFSQDQIRKRREVKLRDVVSTEVAITESQSEYDKAMKEIEKKGQDTIQYRLSQEQYLRGFRDYRQGQYVRAMEEFQAALSFYPNHELARKYYTLAKRKFDEQIQFNMIQGKRYYGVRNYRLCMGYYSTVIKMKKDERDPIRREALQYHNECEIKLRGKY
ncbi:MAG: FHA domain-containing protein [Bdellovibrionaceae bacterium]|nr:FHA domain-containing protein [Pseudobdellovibrionaceae bacterium]